MGKKISDAGTAIASTVTQNNFGTSDAHLCYIVSQGFNITEEQSYLELIMYPKFRCSHCGRQAANNRNLCVPMKL